jgi:3-hydroxy acid dehydrogenase / malonic semialdehyde reductase
MQHNLKEKTVVITGASSGFGAACALQFGQAGAHLLLGARRLDRLRATAQASLQAGAASAQCQSLDVRIQSQVADFAQWIGMQAGHVDVLVNSAGLALGLETLEEGDETDWRTMVETNIIGLVCVTQALLPLMKGRPGAAIINIGSLAGHVAYENGAVYCGSKAAVLQISRSLRLELCGTGIRVCSVDPGMAETEFSLVRFKGDANRASQVYTGVEPLTAQDVAEAVVWAASRPPHVCIDEMLIKCTDQAAPHKVHRRT